MYTVHQHIYQYIFHVPMYILKLTLSINLNLQVRSAAPETPRVASGNRAPFRAIFPGTKLLALLVQKYKY